MAMPRVYDLARELGTDSAALLARLKAHGFTWYRSASEPLDPAALAFLRGQRYTPPPRPAGYSDDLDDDDLDDLDDDRAKLPHGFWYLTTAGAATLAGVTPATIRQWAARGYLTPVGARGRSTLYARRDVNRAAGERRRAVSAQRHAVPYYVDPDLDTAVSTRDAATIAGVAPATIRTWSARGHLIAASEPGRRPQMYRVQDVLKAARRR